MKIISVIGHKKSGKTLLVEKLVQALKKYGSVGTIKHIPDHRIDKEGSDTWRHNKAGADMVIGVTPYERLAIISKNSNNLEDSLKELADNGIDFVVVEGFKDSNLPKIVLGEMDISEINNIKKIVKNTPDISELINIVLAQSEYVTLNLLIKKVHKNPDFKKVGTIGTFTGIVRAVTGNVHTYALEYEIYEGVAEEYINNLCKELKKRDGVVEVLIHHNTGYLEAGKDTIYIVVAAAHRQEMFPVLIEAIERVKAEVPIWKKEHTLEGSFWVSEK
ncbi:MAG: molybdopterin synthase [Methanosarcinales archaeon]